MSAARRMSYPPVFAIFLFALMAVCTPVYSYAKTATTTTLQVTPACLAEGCIVTFTATTVAGSTPIHPGTIFFCDGTIVDCENGIPLGQAQLVAGGTATIKRALLPGRIICTRTFAGQRPIARGLRRRRT